MAARGEVAESGPVVSGGQGVSSLSVEPQPARNRFQGRAQTVPAPDQTPQAEAEPLDPEAAEIFSEPGDENDETRAPEQQNAEPAWKTLNLESRPDRLQEIPVTERAGMLQAKFQEIHASYAARLNQVAQETEQRVRSQVVLEAAVAEIDEMKAGSSAAFDEWAEDFPDRYENYRAYKDQEKRRATPEYASMAQSIVEKSRAITSRLDGHPDAIARLEALRAAEPNRHSATPEGLAQYVIDVTEALQQSNPTTRAAQQRQEDAARLKATPRPDSRSGGTAGDGALTEARLRAMSATEVGRYMATPAGEAEVNRVTQLIARGHS